MAKKRVEHQKSTKMIKKTWPSAGYRQNMLLKIVNKEEDK
jgi:hypothetical protein